MPTIISGTFTQLERAEQALHELQQRGIAVEDTRHYHFEIPPQLGDAKHDEAVSQEGLQDGTMAGAAKGSLLGVAVGIAAAPFIGPAALLAGAGIGAYGGSLLGTMHRMEDDVNDPQKTTGEDLDEQMMTRQDVVAVNTATPDEQQMVIDVLRQHLAEVVARTDNPDDQWRNFHPATAIPLYEDTGRVPSS